MANNRRYGVELWHFAEKIAESDKIYYQYDKISYENGLFCKNIN